MTAPLLQTTELDLEVVDESIENFKPRLLESKHKTIQQILDHAKLISEFADACDKCQGGTTFTTKMQKWLGYSRSSASRWLIIGRQYPELSRTAGNLPNDVTALCQIAAMPSEQREKAFSDGVIHPKVTRQDLANAKAAPPKAKLAPWDDSANKKAKADDAKATQESAPAPTISDHERFFDLLPAAAAKSASLGSLGFWPCPDGRGAFDFCEQHLKRYLPKKYAKQFLPTFDAAVVARILQIIEEARSGGKPAYSPLVEKAVREYLEFRLEAEIKARAEEAAS